MAQYTPSKIFMGDTGSLALGGTLGVIAMLTNTVALLPFVAFISVIETLSVIIQLTSKKFFGRKVFFNSPDHSLTSKPKVGLNSKLQ